MKAIIVQESGSASQLVLSTWPTPRPARREILVKVAATALNRADILQRRGKYPPPEGASPILGLEMAGEITEIGSEVTRWKVGDRVCGLLAGGGYAEYAVIHEDMALGIPDNLTMEQAAALPEVFLTAYQGLYWLGKLKKGEKVLIHAGASGVGTAAIQLAGFTGSKIFVTASPSKHEGCLKLGADKAIDYRTENFEEIILAATQNKGVDVILDFIAAPYFQQNLNCLGIDGRLIILALMGGMKVKDAQLGAILRKRLSIHGSTLRNRSLEYKIALTREFESFAWEEIAQGRIKPVIDSVFELEAAAEAHSHMESNKNIGKIILSIS